MTLVDIRASVAHRKRSEPPPVDGGSPACAVIPLATVQRQMSTWSGDSCSLASFTLNEKA